MRIILDCNVLVSAVISGKTCREVVDEVARFHTWHYSHETLQEFLRVAKYTHLRPYFYRVKKLIKAMQQVGIEVIPAADPVDLPDADDIVYLQTALAARADILITGNRKHFPLSNYQGIRILSPREFLDLVQGGKEQ